MKKLILYGAPRSAEEAVLSIDASAFGADVTLKLKTGKSIVKHNCSAIHHLWNKELLDDFLETFIKENGEKYNPKTFKGDTYSTSVTSDLHSKVDSIHVDKLTSITVVHATKLNKEF